MSDVFILYVVFSYLFGLGCTLVDINTAKKNGDSYASTFIYLLLAPITVPIALGVFITKRA